MENRNIVLLRRHWVNHTDPKSTAVYLNQCPDLADFEVIDVTSHNRSEKFRSEISPMFIGPLRSSDGVVCNVFETLWQCSKVYPCHDANGQPNEEYFEWRNRHFAEPKPSLNDKKAIKALRHVNEELGMAHADTLYTACWDEEKKEFVHLNYVEARKKIYFPEYAKLVYNTDSFKELKAKVDAGEKIALMDFDCLNYYNPDAKARLFKSYVDKCKREHRQPAASIDEYIGINSMKDLVGCSFLPVGHGVVLKALLQGDIEVAGGKVIDHSGILE